ncbi:putative polyprotein [Panicum miliaceum]|uniref:Polyprotein n=1 Tax=Panicum miliaceum TaxID=4540 RepID=A0A3L6PSB2_PANMI|nr:putative polyprotein [Panicum miliaceum]
MTARWCDQEDEENDRFPKRNSDKQGSGNIHFDKGQWNHSGNPRKRKPDQEVVAVERNPRGKKSGNNDAQFEEVLHKQCPMHPKSRHILFECVSLHKSLNTSPLPQGEKRKDQEDDDEGDKSGAQDFQDPKNVANVIFGGDGGFPSKRTQKLTLREILCVEPTTQKPLRYSEHLSPGK